MKVLKRKIFYVLLIIAVFILIFAEFILKELVFLVDFGSDKIEIRKFNIKFFTNQAILHDLKYKHKLFDLFCEKLDCKFSLFGNNFNYFIFNNIQADRFLIESDDINIALIPLYPFVNMKKMNYRIRSISFYNGSIAITPQKKQKLQLENCRGFISFNMLDRNEVVEKFSTLLLPSTRINIEGVRYFDNDSVKLKANIYDYRKLDKLWLNILGLKNECLGKAHAGLKSGDKLDFNFYVIFQKNKSIDIRSLNFKFGTINGDIASKVIFLPEDKIRFGNLNGIFKSLGSYKGKNIFAKTFWRETRDEIDFKLSAIWDRVKSAGNLKGTLRSAKFNFDVEGKISYGKKLAGDFRLYSKLVDARSIEGANQYFHFDNNETAFHDVNIDLSFFGNEIKLKKAEMSFLDGKLVLSRAKGFDIEAGGISSQKFMKLIYPPYDRVSGKLFSKMKIEDNNYAGTFKIKDGVIQNVNLMSKIRKNMPSNIVMDKILDLIEKQSLVFSSTPFKIVELSFKYDGRILIIKNAKMDCTGYQLNIAELKIKGDKLEGTGSLRLDPLFPVRTVTGFIDNLTNDFFSVDTFLNDFEGKISLIPFEISGTLSTPQFNYFKYGNILEKYYKK